MDIVIKSFKDCLNFLVTVTAHIKSDIQIVSSRRCLSLLMLKMKLFQISRNKQLTPQQMMLKAIYKTVESVEVFPEINVETVNEKLYLLSSLIDLGHSINLNIHIDK